MEADELIGWFAGRLPGGWFIAPPQVSADSEEILVVGELEDVDLGPEASDEARASGQAARIKRFREETREQRMSIAAEAQRRFGRHVSWGASCGGERRLFTTASVPVMTRLRMPERDVLDTLVGSGVARSRSDALAWCVKLVGRHQSEWIAQLQGALAEVHKIRAAGPGTV